MPSKLRSTRYCPQEFQLAVDGASLRVRIAGDPSPLPDVVLEAGGGSILERWNLIEGQLAPHLRVFSYERAGIGSSEGTGATCAEVAGRLSMMLRSPRLRQQIRRPVILVGHSLGGLYARYFAATHPQDVIALVLIDATPDDIGMAAIQVPVAGVLMWGLHLLARTGVPKWYLSQKPRNKGYVDVTAAGARAFARARHVHAVLREMSTIPRNQEKVAALGLPKGIPVLCISAGARPPLARKLVVPLQRGNDRLASAGVAPLSRHLCISSATHMGLVSDPAHAEIVGQLILEFARGIRASHLRVSNAAASA